MSVSHASGNSKSRATKTSRFVPLTYRALKAAGNNLKTSKTNLSAGKNLLRVSFVCYLIVGTNREKVQQQASTHEHQFGRLLAPAVKYDSLRDLLAK